MDAAKIRIAQRCRDYNVADHLYACLEYGERKTIDTLKEYLDRGRDPGSGKYDGTTRLDGFFDAQLDAVRNANAGSDEQITSEEAAILNLDLPPFDRYIELVTHVRHRHHRHYLIQMLDKVFQKNSEYGVLVQGKSAGNTRR
jgi:hypothetical protein